MSYTFETVGVIRSPYREKFGIPRQPSLVNAARITLELLPPYDHPDMVRGLDAFSHVWISFVFHQTAERGWRSLVRPPRLGGNAKVGVFASRATHRPNPLGLSLVRLLRIDTQPKVVLTLEGADLLDGTPVLDIKPYIPFVEARPDARGGFVDGPPPQLSVGWDAAAQLATPACRPISRCWWSRCWPRTRAPPIRTTRNGFTAWRCSNGMCASASKKPCASH